MGYTVSFDDDDELDELFEFGLDSQPLEELIDMDGLSDEQKQLLLTGKNAKGEFDKEFYELFKRRENIMTRIFEEELGEDDE